MRDLWRIGWLLPVIVLVAGCTSSTRTNTTSRGPLLPSHTFTFSPRAPVQPSPGNCGGWSPLHLTGTTPLETIYQTDLTLCAAPDGQSEYLANIANGIVWTVHVSDGARPQGSTVVDRFMVALFEGSVSTPGVLLEPGTSFMIPTSYPNITLETSDSRTQVAWAGEKILLKAGITTASGALADALTTESVRGKAVKACLSTAFQDGYAIAATPTGDQAGALNNLWTAPSTFSCASKLYDAFTAPVAADSIPRIEVSPNVITEEASGLRAFLNNAIKVAGEDLPKLIR